MKRHRTLHLAAMLVVLMIMVSAGLITGICAFVLDRAGVLVSMHRSPMLLLIDAIFVSVLLGMVIAYFVSKRFLRPINHVIQATKVVATGDFAIRVPEAKTGTDVDELTRSFNAMIDELDSIEMFRNDFINNFSHELKTPIVSIRGFARQLQQDLLTTEQRREYIDIIASESQRLVDLSSKILLLSKFENQQIVIDKRPYELDEQLRNCILLLEKQWAKKNLSFHIEMEPTVFTGNEEMLAHVWLNLLSNAIEYTREGSELSVRCRYAKGDVRVSIADQGPGMDENTLRHIFEKFYQGDPAHAGKGNGLGLPLVKRIVELCNGHITVESEEGRGTTFVIELPR